MINYLIMGVGFAFASVVQPGPFQAFLLSQSLTNGWRKTIPLVFAPLFSDGPIIVLVLLVLTNVPDGLLKILQCAGGALLLYMAFNAYKTWSTFNENDEQNIPSQLNLFKAVMINFFNPAPYLGWSLIMGPLFLNAWKESPVNGVILLTGFYSTMILCSAGMVLLFSAAGNLGPHVRRIAIGISVIALVIFGIFQLWSGIVS